MRVWAGRLRRMRTSDYVTAAEVLALAVWIEIAISLIPVARLIGRSRRAASSSADESAVASEYRRLQRFVAVVYDVLPFPGTCLRQSLVLYRLLGRRGVRARLRFGVTKRGPTLAAHSWVECDGVSFETPAGSFSELQAQRS